MKNVITRKVRRFYARGKGFSTARNAYLHIAKQNLNGLLNDYEDIELCERCEALPTDAVGETIGELCKKCAFFPYSKKFPYPCENKYHHPIHLRMNPESEYNRVEAKKERGFCNNCRWDWLKAEAKRLQELDDSEETL